MPFTMPLTDQSALPELVSSLPNPHIMKFMLRKKPPPAAAQPRIVYRPAESESVVKYPKDVTGTVLLYVAPPPLCPLCDFVFARTHTRTHH